jgi:hypothetical protein
MSSQLYGYPPSRRLSWFVEISNQAAPLYR